MLSQEIAMPAHAGEEQSSGAFAARSAHWKAVGNDLLQAVVSYVKEYLQEEHDDALVCASQEHHSAVRALFDAIKHADAAGLAKACEELQAAASAPVASGGAA
jgi:DNA-binding FadR family transcriptional regulator